ncbi:hypothetical protein [Streptococcus catagoni]|uniref:hypothetical protein n=1 Tax=Streptococcus catagoni TaxID=2654874 RepID=UPI0014083660|nr:hypothetical protein [Streptococcus catagoni]
MANQMVSLKDSQDKHIASQKGNQAALVSFSGKLMDDTYYSYYLDDKKSVKQCQVFKKQFTLMILDFQK